MIAKWNGAGAACAILAGGLVLQACAARPTKLVAETRCADYSIQIYFDDYSAGLTRAARRVIADAAAQSKSCKVLNVDILGLADYKGPAEPNLALSRQRAETVAQALTRLGFPAPAFTVQAAGETGAVTAAGQVEPLRRRAEVSIHQTPR